MLKRYQYLRSKVNEFAWAEMEKQRNKEEKVVAYCYR